MSICCVLATRISGAQYLIFFLINTLKREFVCDKLYQSPCTKTQKTPLKRIIKAKIFQTAFSEDRTFLQCMIFLRLANREQITSYLQYELGSNFKTLLI